MAKGVPDGTEKAFMVIEISIFSNITLSCSRFVKIFNV